MSRSLLIGLRAEQDAALFSSGTEIQIEPGLAKEYWEKPWYRGIRDSFCMQNDIPPGLTQASSGPEFAVDADLLAHHTLVVGKSGSGKTRLALHLLREQLKGGCSAVVLDCEDETVQQALAIAQEVGFTDSQCTVIWPKGSDHIPGWNLLAGPPEEARLIGEQFADTVQKSTSSDMPKSMDVLRALSVLMAHQGLSVFELAEFLQDTEYQEKLIKKVSGDPSWLRFRQYHRFLEREWLRMGDAERSRIANTILNKIRPLVANEYLSSLFSAERSTIDFPGLWKKPQLLAIHLNRKLFNDEGVRLFASIFTDQLFRTAEESPGPGPVVLMLDEIRVLEKAIGESAIDILTRARKRHLRVIACCQRMDQVSDDLREELLTNTGFRAFFNLGETDARRVARVMSLKRREPRKKVVVGTARSREPVLVEVGDGNGGGIYIADYDAINMKKVIGQIFHLEPGEKYRFVSEEEYNRTALALFYRDIPDQWKQEVKRRWDWMKRAQKWGVDKLLKVDDPPSISKLWLEKVGDGSRHPLPATSRDQDVFSGTEFDESRGFYSVGIYSWASREYEQWMAPPIEPTRFIPAYVRFPGDERWYEFEEFRRMLVGFVLGQRNCMAFYVENRHLARHPSPLITHKNPTIWHCAEVKKALELAGGCISSISFDAEAPCVISTTPLPDRDRSAGIEDMVISLPKRHAVIRTEIGETACVEVSPVEFGPLPDPTRYTANCLSPQEVTATETRRLDAVQAVIAGRYPVQNQTAYTGQPAELFDDNSL